MCVIKVTFCGHSVLTSSEIEYIRPKLHKEIEKLILKGASEFLLGGYGDFDRLCASAIKKLKNTYPHIKSILVIPYIDRKFDESVYDYSEYPPLEAVPKRFAILKRNEYMVDSASVLISYITRSFGGAYKTFKYASGRTIEIVHI